MEKFLEDIAEILEVSESDLRLDENFKDHESWDSLAQLSFMALADDDYGIIVSHIQLEQANTFRDLFELLKIN